jgi:hypothetical protein
MNGFMVVVLGLIVSGCAAGPHSPIDTMADVPVICKKEKPTGSHVPVNVCRPVPGVFDREDTERDMRVIQRQSEQ